MLPSVETDSTHMSIGPTSDRLLSGLSRRGAVGSFGYDLAPGVPANRVDDPLSLCDAQLASLRRALEVDLGPELSGVRVDSDEKPSENDVMYWTSVDWIC